MAPIVQPILPDPTNSSLGCPQANAMTKKKIREFVQGYELNRSIPLRQAGDHGDVHEPLSDGHDDALAGRPQGTASLSESAFHHTPRLSVSSNHHVKSDDSNIGYSAFPSLRSNTDTLSPTPTFTPPESTFPPSPYSPVSITSLKRPRTGSTDDQFWDEGRGSTFMAIAGLLNPSSGQSTPCNSPPCEDVAQSDSSAVVTNSARVKDERPPPLFSPPGFRPHTGSQFTWIAPRPNGYHDRQPPEEAIAESPEAQPPPKKKGRTGAFKTDEERKAIFAVREAGACLRCQIMRIKCDPVKDQACSNCRETSAKSRKWTLPCTRKPLTKRWKYFFPEFLAKHHDFMKTFPNIAQEYLFEEFKITLIHPANFSFEFSVCEVADLEKAGLDENYFDKYDYSHLGGPGNANVVLEKSSSLPLIPAERRWREQPDHAIKMMMRLLNRDPNKRKKWQSEALPADKGQLWARKVLLMVMHFHNETNNSAALEQALKCCEIRCLLNHPFGIDPSEMESLNIRLSKRSWLTWQEIQMKKCEEDLWSPKMVNRWLKTTLHHVMRIHLPALFEQLENSFKLLDNRGDEAKLSELDRDETFCTIVACFVVFGTSQKKLYQAATAWEKDSEYRNDEKFKGVKGAMIREAKRCIKEIETEVVDHILQLYKYRFNRQTMKGHAHAGQEEVAKKAQNFGGYGENVIAEFQRLIRVAEFQETLTDIRLTLDVDSEEGIKQLQNNNVTRLLLRLNREIWRPRSQRNRLRDQL